MTNPNSLVDHRMISSASRLRSTPTWAATNANSATKSRDAVPSIELGVESVEAELARDRRAGPGRGWSRPGHRSRTASRRRPGGPSRAAGRRRGAAARRGRAGGGTAGRAGRAGGACVPASPRRGGRAPGRRGRRPGRAGARRWRARGRAGTSEQRGDLVVARCGRRGAGRRRRRPTSSISSRSSAPCTSSSDGSGSSEPVGVPVAPARRGRRAAPWSSSVSSPAACRALAWAREPGEVVGREPPVEVGRPRQRLELGRRPRGEAAAPELALVGARSPVRTASTPRARMCGRSWVSGPSVGRESRSASTTGPRRRCRPRPAPRPSKETSTSRPAASRRTSSR